MDIENTDNRTHCSDKIALNRKLFDACVSKTPDFSEIEKMLKSGADPLGPIDPDFAFEHLYTELICELCDERDEHLPRITELFLKYGMNLSSLREDSAYCGEHPMWNFAFFSGDNVAQTLKILLDNGLDSHSAGLCWSHEIGDLIDVYGYMQDEYDCKSLMWAIKKTMLFASYDHILENDDNLRRFIGYDYNSYDLKRFRNWNDFEYIFDTTHCVGEPELYRSIVRILDKRAKQEVWTIGVYLEWVDENTVKYIKRNERDFSGPIVCPICGKYTFKENGDFDKCPVCLWWNDIVQNCEPGYKGGANHMSQNEYRAKYLAGKPVK